MATFSYNGINFEQVQTVSLAMEPVYDPSGVDWECTKAAVTIVGTVNPRWVTTNIDANGVGDRAGIFLDNVKQALEEPRGRLVYTVGSDTVILSPANKTEAGDEFYTCDIRGGPFTSGVRVNSVVGDKSLIVSMTVTTYVAKPPDNHILLSNRWTWSSSVDEYLMAAVHISGRASFRKDMLDHLIASPDDFRSAVIPPPDIGMRRMSVSVNVNPASYELTYQAVDRAVNYGLATHGITKMEVQASGGAYGAKPSSVGALAAQALRLGKSVTTRDHAAVCTMIANAIDNLMPQASFSVTARAWGRPDANREMMLSACRQVAISRFAGNRINIFDNPSLDNVLNPVRPISYQVMSDWSTDGPPVVQFSADFFVDMFAAGAASFLGIPTFFNWSSAVPENLAVASSFAPGAPVVPLPLPNPVKDLDLMAGPRRLQTNPLQPLGAPGPSRAQRAGQAFAQVLLDPGRSGDNANAIAPAEPGDHDRALDHRDGAIPYP